MKKIELRDDFIKLGQAMKLMGVVGSGSDAKNLILDGLVQVNGTVETRRGRKLYDGDIVLFEGMEYGIAGQARNDVKNDNKVIRTE